MDDISATAQGEGASQDEREKLRVLARDFGRLEEGRKDYIRELTRKLAEIHREGERGGAVFYGAASPFQI